MPLKTLKTDAADALTLEWVLQVKNYKLTLDKNRCVGCQVCTMACPKEAVKTMKQPKIAGEKAKKAKVDVDLAKCNFCGICDVTCPYGAINVTINDSHNLPILEKDSFPQLVREIEVDTNKCGKECVECEAACPLKLIKISKVEELLANAYAMLNDTKTALENENSRMAMSVFSKDILLDEVTKESNDIIGDYILKHPEEIDESLNIHSIIRKIERMGDLSSNIAEEIVFYIDAKYSHCSSLRFIGRVGWKIYSFRILWVDQYVYFVANIGYFINLSFNYPPGDI